MVYEPPCRFLSGSRLGVEYAVGEGAADADESPAALHLVVEGEGEVLIQREALGGGWSLPVRLFVGVVGHSARCAVHDRLGQQADLGELS